MTATRNKNLGVRRDGNKIWRFVDLSTGASVGEVYASKTEALSDLARYEFAAGWID